MTSFPLLVATLLSAQVEPGPAPVVEDAASRAAAAAEKAAQAAAVAAEAAQKAAEAAARISATVPATGPAAAPPAKAAAPANAAPEWTGTVGLGLISLTGNARTVTFNTNAAAERKSTGWIVGTKVYATYGQNRAAEGGGTDTVAEAAGGLLRLDRRFGARYSGYVLGALDTDHVKSVELRTTGEAGATVVWVDTGEGEGSRTTLRTDLGFRVAHERRYQYYPTKANLPNETLYAPRLGLAFKHALSKDVLFTEDAELLTNVVGEGRVVVNSVAKVRTRLSRTLAFGVVFTVNHDSRPAPDKVPTDTSLALTLDVLL